MWYNWGKEACMVLIVFILLITSSAFAATASTTPPPITFSVTGCSEEKISFAFSESISNDLVEVLLDSYGIKKGVFPTRKNFTLFLQADIDPDEVMRFLTKKLIPWQLKGRTVSNQTNLELSCKKTINAAKQ